jgi:hypothetical protein
MSHTGIVEVRLMPIGDASPAQLAAWSRLWAMLLEPRNSKAPGGHQGLCCPPPADPPIDRGGT